jgi:tetratricopeptide (TPR) repeat protein
VILLLAQAVAWTRDYEAALAEAKKNDRRVAVHFQIKGRPAGQAMLEETFASAEVARRSAAFLNVWVDIDARPELFDRLLGGKGALGTCVVDGEGDVVSALPGFAGPNEYVRFLERAEKGYAGLRAAREKSGAGPEAMLALAEAYREIESPRRAEDCYRKVIEGGGAAGPAAVAHERLARYRVMRGKNVDARRHVAEFRRLDPENRTGRADRILLTEGLAFYVERKFDESRRTLEEALAKFPQSPEADHLMVSLGVVLHESGDDKRAMPLFQEMLRRFPDSPWAPEARQRIEHIKNPPPDHTH